MARKWSPKDPSDVANFWFDWGSSEQSLDDRFLPEAETIVTASVSIQDEEDQPEAVSPYTVLAIVSQSDDSDKTVRVKLAGGVPSNQYPVTCLITTSEGQIFEWTKKLTIRERLT